MLAVVLIDVLGCEQSTSSTSTPEPAAASASHSSTDELSHHEPDSPTTTTPSHDRPRIVAFGDSLTAGLGVSPAQSYPTQLQRRLDALGHSYQIVNAGVSGETTAGGLRRVAWILAAKPYMVILELGGNDGLRGLSLPETRSHLDTIISRFKEARVPVLLVGMKLPPNYGREYTERFEAMYRELATTHALPLVPFLLEGVGGEKSLNQADGIHPTGEGYRIVADNVLKSLLPLLDQRKDVSPDTKKKARNTPPPSSVRATLHAMSEQLRGVNFY
jgi:acyl-CoA thioesterase-1